MNTIERMRAALVHLDALAELTEDMEWRGKNPFALRITQMRMKLTAMLNEAELAAKYQFTEAQP